MPKKIEIQYQENNEKIKKLLARQKEIEAKMKARTNYKKRKERTHKMILLSGEIEKLFREVVGEKIFDENFEYKKTWFVDFFAKNLLPIFQKKHSYQIFLDHAKAEAKKILEKEREE